MAKTPDKYHPKNQKWTRIDQKKNCNDEGAIIECPKCLEEHNMNNLGHLDIYLNSAKQTDKEVGADIVCKHAHFTIDVDRGRNVWCVLEKVMIPKDNLKVTYTIHDKKRLPQWIKDKLDGKSL